MSTAAILLSRQPKHPHGGLLWVQRTVAAVRWAGDRGYTVLTSVGMNTWEIILSAARLNQVPVRVIGKSESGDRSSVAEIRLQFDLPDSVDITFPIPEEKRGRDTRRERDSVIVASADLLIPISIRPGGHMASLIAEAESQGKAVDSSFVVDYEARVEPLAYGVPLDNLTDEGATVGCKYVTHWTRAASHRWPDERAVDYYRAVMNARRYPRTACDTLQNILTTRRVISSRRHMPRNTATVSFTALSIADTLPLMRWRAKYAEMAFEPYGVGIRRDLAASAGLYPVQYFDPEVGFTNCTVEPWLTQSIGQKTDWRQECEYRHKGDLNLRSVPDTALIAFCRTKSEAAALESAAGIRTIALFG